MANYLYLPDSPEPTIWNILDSKNPTGYTPYGLQITPCHLVGP